ncbi:MAG TPA: hypothetical protein VHB25_20475 [Gemmatimonadaceae bacterium]|nr:hypothetical protein [Gemmatimonadaceae bacterium]
MLTLGNVLFPPADYRRTARSRLVWWESRRPTYNLIVGATGLVTLAVVNLIALIPPGFPGPRPPWMVIVAYGVLANVCYTLGWGIETVMHFAWKEKAPDIGPALFRQGLAFSVGLTALPMLIASMTWVARLGALVLHLR